MRSSPRSRRSHQSQGFTRLTRTRQLVQTWKRLSEDFVHVAFDPRDNDTVTVAVYTGEFWPNLAAWRKLEKSNAKRFSGKLLTVDEKDVGAHHAFSSIIGTGKGGLLIGTMVIEQSDGKYVVVSATLDGVDPRDDRADPLQHQGRIGPPPHSSCSSKATLWSPLQRCSPGSLLACFTQAANCFSVELVLVDVEVARLRVLDPSGGTGSSDVPRKKVTFMYRSKQW